MANGKARSKGLFTALKIPAAVLLVAALNLLTGATMADDYRKNTYTLTYAGAITENVAGRLRGRKSLPGDCGGAS